MNKPIVRDFGHFDNAIDLACLERGMPVDTTKTQSPLRTEKLDAKVAKLHIPCSSSSLHPETGHIVDPADGVFHSRICCTLNRWRAFVTLAVSTRKRGFSGFPPRPGFPGFAECRGHLAQKNPRCVLIKWLLPASLARLRTSHDQNFVTCLGSGSLLLLRRPCGQLLRQWQSCSLQALRRTLCQLLRQRQNDPVRVGGDILTDRSVDSVRDGGSELPDG